MKKRYASMALVLALAMPFNSFAGSPSGLPGKGFAGSVQEFTQAESPAVTPGDAEMQTVVSDALPSAPQLEQGKGRKNTSNPAAASNIPKPPIFTPDMATAADLDYGNLQSTDVTILPEKMTAVEMSNSDVNRITCPGPIEDLIFSSEKGMEGNFVGDNAFIKFKIAKKGTERTYSSIPSELFVACQGKIYSLIATPKRIPSATIRLSPGKEDAMKKNVAEFEGMPFEKKVLRLIKQAYKSKFPDSYMVRTMNLKVELAPNLEVALKRVVDVEGEGFRIKEFLVSPKGVQQVEIDEKLFLRRNVGEKIAAIAIDEHVLKNGKSTRVFVIEVKELQS